MADGLESFRDAATSVPSPNLEPRATPELFSGGSLEQTAGTYRPRPLAWFNARPFLTRTYAPFGKYSFLRFHVVTPVP